MPLFVDPGVVVLDDIDGDITGKVKTLGLPIDTTKLGVLPKSEVKPILQFSNQNAAANWRLHP
jgi:hypothetical protein